jgi:Cu/Ag efflux protein CusF
MKKIITGVMILFLGITVSNAASPTDFNTTGKIKKGFVTDNQTGEANPAPKKHIMTGLIKAIDSDKKTITIGAVKKKNITMTFSYDGISINNGKNVMDVSDLKIGDRLKVLYVGDVANPEIKKISFIKAPPKITKNHEKATVKKTDSAK